MSRTTTIAKMQLDGKLVRRRPDGTEKVLSVPPLEPMCDADVEAAAVGDPDNPPLSPERLARLRPVPRVKTLRRALGLTWELAIEIADELFDIAERQDITSRQLHAWI